jgi:hypothetical protein
MFLRHKLQKGLLSRDGQPKEEEMKQMSDYITKLEEHLTLEVSIMRGTKINKVLKAILKLDAIPKEEEFKFKERSQKLLDAWNKILNAEQPTANATGAVEHAPEKELTNGASTAKTEEKQSDSEAKAEGKSADPAPVAVIEPAETTKEEKTVEPAADADSAPADEAKVSQDALQ